MPSAPPDTLQTLAARHSPTRMRTIEAALDLFADHGVSGTSLQTIADSLGVTKAAIYHQFPTKEAIVLAVIEVKLAPIEAALEVAEAAGPSRRAREDLLAAVIDIVVGNRRVLGTLQRDPILLRSLAEHDASRRMWVRLFSVLLGDDLDAPARVRAAVLSAAIGSVDHPFVADLGDDAVRDELLAITRRLIFVPG